MCRELRDVLAFLERFCLLAWYVSSMLGGDMKVLLRHNLERINKTAY